MRLGVVLSSDHRPERLPEAVDPMHEPLVRSLIASRVEDAVAHVDPGAGIVVCHDGATIDDLVHRLHIRSVPSACPVSRDLPSGENATEFGP